MASTRYPDIWRAWMLYTQFQDHAILNYLCKSGSGTESNQRGISPLIHLALSLLGVNGVCSNVKVSVVKNQNKFTPTHQYYMKSLSFLYLIIIHCHYRVNNGHQTIRRRLWVAWLRTTAVNNKAGVKRLQARTRIFPATRKKTSRLINVFAIKRQTTVLIN